MTARRARVGFAAALLVPIFLILGVAAWGGAWWFLVLVAVEQALLFGAMSGEWETAWRQAGSAPPAPEPIMATTATKEKA